MLVGVIDRARKSRDEIIEAGRSIGDEILPPAIEVVPPRIGEAIADEDLEFPSFWVEAEYASIAAALRAEGGLDLRLMERAFLKVEGHARIPNESMFGMV